MSLRIYIKGLIIITSVFCAFSCISKFELFGTSSNSISQLPFGFPEFQIPDDNAFTKDRWLLGKKLFYDNALSKDNSISCSSCHIPELAFSDSLALSLGFEKRVGTRNAPSLGNVAYHPYYTRDGGVATLEMQILVPIQEHNEFNFNILEIADKLKKTNKKYSEMSMKAYNRELDYYVITRAIANFERTLISGQSKYDLYTFRKKTNALSEEEKRGMNLFFSDKTNCSQCHSGFNFTSYSFENTGLYESYSDIGRKRLTLDNKDLELFKVPSLRNIALTAPYMHDGSIKTIDEVIEHYNLGGKNNPRKSSKIKPLHLTSVEKNELKKFLYTLTDNKFISNQQLKP